MARPISAKLPSYISGKGLLGLQVAFRAFSYAVYQRHLQQPTGAYPRPCVGSPSRVSTPISAARRITQAMTVSACSTRPNGSTSHAHSANGNHTAAADQDTFDFFFHGTGCSSALPLATCLAQADTLEEVTCRSCREAALALYDTRKPAERGGNIGAAVDPLWARNARGNIGGVIRKRDPLNPSEVHTVVIDVGKTFREQSIRLFPRWGIRRIDAVILTHAHADAISGLDDLRAWCPRAGAGGGSIPVYVSRETLAGVKQQFPYLVDASKATGGGHVPRLEWRVFDERVDGSVPGRGGALAGGDDEMEEDNDNDTADPPAFYPIPGLRCLPLRLHHGRHFAPRDKPYVCWGFLFDRKLAYLSDLHHVPAGTWKQLNEAMEGGASGVVEALPPPRVDPSDLPADTHPTGSSTAAVATPAPALAATSNGTPHRRSVIDTSLVPRSSSSSSSSSLSPSQQLPLLVIDCLRVTPYASHLGYFEALHIAALLRPARTFLVGFADGITHAEWEAACQEVDGTRSAGREETFVSKVKHDSRVLGWEREYDEWTTEWRGHVRPAWDGLRLRVGDASCEEVE